MNLFKKNPKGLNLHKKKVFYFCRRGLGTHLQFYIGWVMEARRRGLPIYLFTTTGFKEYFNRSPQLKKKEFVFIPCLKRLDKIVYCLFFILQLINNKLTIIQLRKRYSYLFDKHKLVFHKRIKYIVERGC